MKVLVTGFDGQLGYAVVETLKSQGVECIGTTKRDLDVTKFDVVNRVLTVYQPDVVIHCASYTLVDKAENNVEECYLVNSLGTKNIATACKIIDAKLVYISTDYVFDGTKNGAYDIDDIPNPLNVYGKSKFKGEIYVRSILEKYFIIRISWLFGPNGNNFVKTILQKGRDLKEVTVVDDQIGSPTFSFDIAKVLCELIKTEKYSIYHITNEGECSWAEFAKAIFEFTNEEIFINNVPTNKYSFIAFRPMNSRMSKRVLYNAGFSKLRHWKEALKEYLYTNHL